MKLLSCYGRTSLSLKLNKGDAAVTNHVIDNSLKNLGKTILWQYDRATRLLSIIKHLQAIYHCAVEQFWDFWRVKVLSIDTCGSFGNSIWGLFLGVPNIEVTDREGGTEHFLAPSVYRKVLKGAFYLMKANSSMESILGYLEIVFGIDGRESLTKWEAEVSEYGWTTNVDELNFRYEAGREYKEGFVFWYDGEGYSGNWKCKRDILPSENTSFAALVSPEEGLPLIARTEESCTETNTGSTILFQLIDPEGIVRKITGGNRDALSLEIKYQFGETLITATAGRRRKCGVKIVDNQDMTMTYAKSQYFSEMHRDQQALFEQKIDEICPLPLGVCRSDKKIVETWLFGFDGQQPDDMYESGKAYSEGDVFGYVDEEGHGFHWKCLSIVSAQENQSFDAIKGKLEKTDEGDPFVDGIVETDAFDFGGNGGVWGNWGEFENYVTLYMGKVTTVFSVKIDNYGFLAIKDNGIPTEFTTDNGGFEVSLLLDGIVLPIESEIWEKALSALLKDGRLLYQHEVTEEQKQIVRDFFINSGYSPAEAEAQVNIFIGVKFTSLTRVAYNKGELREGGFYREGCIVRRDGEYKYVKTGGTFDNKVFSGELMPTGKSNLLEFNEE